MACRAWLIRYSSVLGDVAAIGKGVREILTFVYQVDGSVLSDD